MLAATSFGTRCSNTECGVIPSWAVPTKKTEATIFTPSRPMRKPLPSPQQPKAPKRRLPYCSGRVSRAPATPRAHDSRLPRARRSRQSPRYPPRSGLPPTPHLSEWAGAARGYPPPRDLEPISRGLVLAEGTTAIRANQRTVGKFSIGCRCGCTARARERAGQFNNHLGIVYGFGQRCRCARSRFVLSVAD